VPEFARLTSRDLFTPVLESLLTADEIVTSGFAAVFFVVDFVNFPLTPLLTRARFRPVGARLVNRQFAEAA